MSFIEEIKKRKVETLGWAIYGSLTLFTALNIASERFGSPDDLSITTMQTSPIGLIESAKQAAISQGRIQQILFYSLDNIGLSEKYSLTTPVIKFISVIAIFLLFGLIIKILYSAIVSLIASLILISTIATSGEYNALNSFPLWFTAGIISFQVSLLLFLKLIKNQNIPTLISFGITSIFSLLSSEVFFLIFFTYPLLHLKIVGKELIKNEVKKLKATYIFITSALSLYLFTYVLFKVYTSGTYEGARITLSNPLKSFISSIALSLGQINIYALKRQLIENQLKLSFIFLFISVILIFVLYYALRKLAKSEIKNSNLEIISILTIAILGNLLLGFTEKYSRIGLVYPLYLNSLISFLFICTASALIIVKFLNLTFLRLFIIFFISIFGYLSLLDQQNVYSKIRLNQNVFKVSSCIANNPELISEINSQVLSPEMQKLSKSYSYNYFGEKFRLVTGKNFYFYQDFKSLDLQQKYTKIALNLERDYAQGQITNVFQNETTKIINFQVFYHECNFKLVDLTPSQRS
jgi:hypothetical protein